VVQLFDRGVESVQVGVDKTGGHGSSTWKYSVFWAGPRKGL
jgi:hypothetical protein